MAGTQGRRSARDRLASASLRRAPVGLGTPGVSGVRRREGSQALTVPSASGALEDYGYLRIDAGTAGGTAVGTGLQLLKGSAVTNGLADTSWASYNTSTGIFTVARAGLWVLSAYVVVTTPVAGASLSVNTPRVASAEASPMAWFHADAFPGVGGAFTSATTSPPTPWFASGTGYCAHYAPSAGATYNQFYLVLYPTAFFD
jgi:hypothetical protein